MLDYYIYIRKILIVKKIMHNFFIKNKYIFNYKLIILNSIKNTKHTHTHTKKK